MWRQWSVACEYDIYNFWAQFTKFGYSISDQELLDPNLRINVNDSLDNKNNDEKNRIILGLRKYTRRTRLHKKLYNSYALFAKCPSTR